MTNKVQKIREEVEKLKSQLLRCACSSQIAMETRCKEEAYNEVLAILDTMQEESIDYDKLNTMLNDALSKETKESWNEMLGKEEPESKDYRERYKRIAQSEAFKRTHEGMSVGEVMHVEGEECISEIDFEQELYKAFGQVKDFTLGMRIAKRFYDMGRNHQEPVSNDLEEAARRYATEGDEISGLYIIDEEVDAFRAGAKWQKTKDESTTEDLGEYINELSKQFPEVSFAKLSRIAVRVAKWQMAQMMKDATEVSVHIEAGNYPYIPQLELYDYDKDIPLAKEGDKYKVVLIKED